MRKTIYLHIGHYKTGTTALQVFLDSNRDTLQNLGKLWNKGVDYPDQFAHFAKHSQMAFSIYREAGMTKLMYGFRDQTPAKERWHSFFDYVRQSKCPSILISSEEFMRMGANPKAAQLLKDIISPVQSEFNFKIIAYLRRPDAHLRSWYNQLVKLKQPVPDFNNAVCNVMEPIHYDFGLALRPWMAIFGQEAVVVRAYTEDLRKDGALFRDFLSILDIPFDGKNRSRWILPDNGINARLEERYLELTRITQNLCLTKERSEWLRKNLVNQLEAQRPDSIAQLTFPDIVEQSRQGLEDLKSNSQTSSVAKALGNYPPRGDTTERMEMLNLVQLLLHENTVLRQRIQQSSNASEARLAAIEEKLGLSKSGKK